MNKNNLPFKPTNIMVPTENHEKWSVIACDQYTSDMRYWNELEESIGKAKSALHIVLPEIYLEEGDVEKRIEKINDTMNQYLKEHVLSTYEDALIYIERTLPDGTVRCGILGAVDLEEYDFNPEKSPMVRATEETVLERIPPRVEIRKNAALEVSHVMLLIDDVKQTVIEDCVNDKKTNIYDFQLSMGGGSMKGFVLSDEAKERVFDALAALGGEKEKPFLFAVGDGNHSLATAKTCYEQNRTELNRYALAEIVNIHSPALCFEPIYRILMQVDVEKLLVELESVCVEEKDTQKYTQKDTQEDTHEIMYYTEEKSGTLRMKKTSTLAVGTLQNFLDKYIEANPTVKIDYIHGIEEVRELANQENSIGFVFDGMDKSELFPAVSSDGALPRKTFSMGEARSKRYYMECRRIDGSK